MNALPYFNIISRISDDTLVGEGEAKAEGEGWRRFRALEAILEVKGRV